MNTISEKPKSPLTILLLEKLARLPSGFTPTLLWEYYDPKSFGGATALRMAIAAIWLEIETRDPRQPFEIVLACPDADIRSRATYVRNFLTRHDASDPTEPTYDLIEWLIENWNIVYQLIHAPTSVQKLDYETFAKSLDETRHAKIMAALK
jgi:hypothetical protein